MELLAMFVALAVVAAAKDAYAKRRRGSWLDT